MEDLFSFKPISDDSKKLDANKILDVAIIGAGPAGLTAAIYSSRSKLNTVVFEKLFPGGEIATSEWVENFPGFPEGISGSDLAEKIKAQALRFGSVITNEEVKNISKDKDIFTLETYSQKIKAKAVIYATGAEPVKLPVKEEEKFRGKGISYCATCDAAFFKDKEVAIVGGGDTALHEANYLSKYAKKISVIHRRKQLRATKILQEESFSNPKIVFELEYVPVKVLGDMKVEGIEIENVSTKEKKVLNVSGIFVAIGTIPNSDLLKGLADLDEKGYVIVNSKMETSLPGLYAAGDVRNTPLKQVITACADGAIAAFQAEKYIENLKI